MKTRNIIIVLSLFITFILSGCVTKTKHIRAFNEAKNNHTPPKHKIDPKTEIKKDLVKDLKFKRVTYGRASWYGKRFHGKKTTSGEIYNGNKRTASHKTLPFNTMVKITDMVSNKSDIVRINDRGSLSSNRIIDLSYATAKKLGLIKRGITDVKMEIVGVNGKIDKNLLRKLPIPKKACVGDNCLANVPTREMSSDTTKPFSILAQYRTPKQSISNLVQPIDIKPKKISIQVGAFRKHSGADIYMKRYSLLNSRYKAVIKNGMKDSKPIYRVQIEGFGNEQEVKRFISKYRYHLNGAFLVRK
jgi:rare lipoprotein A